MKLKIDNFDGVGVRDCTSTVDASRLPALKRRLNQPSELRFSLVPAGAGFVVPVSGARVIVTRESDQALFTGYVVDAPVLEPMGWGQNGAVYRYNLVALSDETILDRKRLPDRMAFIARGAGNALQQLSNDLLPGVLNGSLVQTLDTLPSYVPDPQKTFSNHAAGIGLRARAVYRADSGALSLAPVGATVHTLDESSAQFSPDGLKLTADDAVINDVTLLGLIEPQDYVHDYCVGDGSSLRFIFRSTHSPAATILCWTKNIQEQGRRNAMEQDGSGECRHGERRQATSKRGHGFRRTDAGFVRGEGGAGRGFRIATR